MTIDRLEFGGDSHESSAHWFGMTFLCSDLSLSDEQVLEHYSHRWKIEVMFKQQKQYLGLKSFMIRSAKAIDRFLIILTLAWFWFTWQTGFVLPFSVGIRRYRGALSIL